MKNVINESGRNKMKKINRLLRYLTVALLLITSARCAIAQCSLNMVNITYVSSSTGQALVTPICSGQATSIKLSNLQEGATYQLIYGSTTLTSRQYWSDGNFTTITWSVGSLTQSLSYTINAWRDGCSSALLTTGSISVASASSASITLTSNQPDPAQVCANQTITLSASNTGITTYTWHSNPAIDIVSFNNGQYHATSFSPDMPANYWVTGTGACNATATSNTIAVGFIQPTSGASIPSGTMARCKGSGTSTYTAHATNATSYKWSITGSGNLISPNSPTNYSGSGTVSGIVTWDSNFIGSATVTVTFYGCGGSTTSNQIQVSTGMISPATLSGSADICPAGAPINNTATLRLTSNSSSGYLDDVQYKIWFNGGNPNVQWGHTNDEYGNPVREIIWTKSGVGTYTVTASGNGCVDIPMSGTATISNKTLGSISIRGYSSKFSETSQSTFNVCDTDGLKLKVVGSPDYTWYSDRPQPDIHNFDPPGQLRNTELQPYQTGVYWVKGKESVCLMPGAESNHVGVTIGNPSAASITPNGLLKVISTDYGRVVSLASLPTQSVSYRWFNGTSVIPNETGSSLNLVSTGNYTVEVTSASGACVSTSPISLQYIRNQRPVVSGGGDQTLILPTRSAVLNGSASDPDGTILKYEWTLESDQTDPVLTGDKTSTLSATDLHQNVYQFRLTATDDMYESNVADAYITVQSPPNNYNYVKESMIQVEGKTTDASLSGLPVEQKLIHTTYIDGLGRTMQSVSHQQSISGQDLVQPVVYDAFGRDSIKYLPYVSTQNNGNYVANPVGATSHTGSLHYNFYTNGTADKIIDDAKPFAVTIFEPSPLNRVIKQGSPGTMWQPQEGLGDHTVKKRYEFNQVQDSVFLFNYNTATGLVTADYYAAHSLFANKTFDEEDNMTIEFTDNQGKMVCKKVQYADTVTSTLFASTYYVYDDLGNLVVVIPPEGVEKIKSILQN